MPSDHSRPPALEAFRAPARIRDVALHVRELDRLADFYEHVLGFGRHTHEADQVVLGSADGTPLLRLVHRPDLPPPSSGTPGLFHVAFLLPTRRDLADWVGHARLLGVRLEGASDHLVSEAIYLSDPEGNGIEMYVDRPRAVWAADGSGIKMATLPLDGPGLLSEATPDAGPWHFPADGRIGHVHLKVGELAAAEAFYRDHLGLSVMARYPGAVFFGWGGYHHHIAVNVWTSKGAAPRLGSEAGLAEVTLSAETRPPWPVSATGEWRDPAGNLIRLVA
jgi:catechol 2,3-dioxygenase